MANVWSGLRVTFAKLDRGDYEPASLAVGIGGWIFWDIRPMTHEVRAFITDTPEGRLVIAGLSVLGLQRLRRKSRCH